jgi:tetratricopeptide (TPR) repeat protein
MKAFSHFSFLGCYLLSFTILYGNQEMVSGRPEAISLLGSPLYPPPLPPETRERMEKELQLAIEAYRQDSSNVENLIWVGRRTAYLWRYREAIDIFTEGIKKFPEDARLYRHRGHRFVTVREFDRAIADLTKALSLVEGKEDEIEPDGQPNKYNIPTSTLHTNIFYHLALAYYLKGDFENAYRFFNECRLRSKNDDMLCAATDWTYLALRRMKGPSAPTILLDTIHKEMRILENTAYHRRLLMYKGELQVDALLKLDDPTDLELATYGYGVAAWYLSGGDTVRAVSILQRVAQSPYWAAFGTIAAEADLRRLQFR